MQGVVHKTADSTSQILVLSKGFGTSFELNSPGRD